MRKSILKYLKWKESDNKKKIFAYIKSLVNSDSQKKSNFKLLRFCNLTDQIIEKIFIFLELKEFNTISLVCQRFYEILFSDQVMQEKSYQRYPLLRELQIANLKEFKFWKREKDNLFHPDSFEQLFDDLVPAKKVNEGLINLKWKQFLLEKTRNEKELQTLSFHNVYEAYEIKMSPKEKIMDTGYAKTASYISRVEICKERGLYSITFVDEGRILIQDSKEGWIWSHIQITNIISYLNTKLQSNVICVTVPHVDPLDSPIYGDVIYEYSDSETDSDSDYDYSTEEEEVTEQESHEHSSSFIDLNVLFRTPKNGLPKFWGNEIITDFAVQNITQTKSKQFENNIKKLWKAKETYFSFLNISLFDFFKFLILRMSPISVRENDPNTKLYFDEKKSRKLRKLFAFYEKKIEWSYYS